MQTEIERGAGMSITGQGFKDCLVGMEHNFLCECFASVLYQLFQKGISISTIEVPQYIDGFENDGTYFRIEGRIKTVSIEERVELNFSKYDKKVIENSKKR